MTTLNSNIFGVVQYGVRENGDEFYCRECCQKQIDESGDTLQEFFDGVNHGNFNIVFNPTPYENVPCPYECVSCANIVKGNN